MDQPPEKRPRSDHHGAGREAPTVGKKNRGHPAGSYLHVCGLALDDFEVRLSLQQFLHGVAIELSVRLGAGAADGRALLAVEHAELDTGGVGGQPHDAVEGIDLANQVALAEAADRRIAGHDADGRQRLGHQGGAGAHARRGGRGFGAGVAAADHDNIEFRAHAPSIDGAGAVVKADDVSRETLFADTELAENHVQQILDIDPPRDPAKGIAGAAEFFGSQLKGKRGIQSFPNGPEAFLKGRAMAGAGEEGALRRRRLGAHPVGQHVQQIGDATAGYG